MTLTIMNIIKGGITMALFGFGKKKQQPAPAPVKKPEPEPVKIDAPPYEQYVRIDGQWHLNPNYDPNAPKPPKVIVVGLNDDEDEEEEDDE